MQNTNTTYRIAYVEIDTHAEIAHNFRELMRDLEGIEVDYFFSKKIMTTLCLAPSENIYETSADTLCSLLERKPYDAVVLGTVHRYFDTFLKVVKRFPTAIIGHNLNFIGATNANLLQSIGKEDGRFRLKLLLKEGLLSKNKVYQKAKAIWVLDEAMGRPPYQYFPVFFNQFSGVETDENLMRVVIPGAVSQQRRDYADVVARLRRHRFQKPTEVVFLGKASGGELALLKQFETEIKDRNDLSIRYFTEKVSQPIFDEEMKAATVLWCPIQQETSFFSIKEYYGTTKVSGNIGDAIKYGKQAVFPSNYAGKYPLVCSENVIFGLEKLQDESFELFSLKKVQEQVETMILKLINH